MTPEQLNERLNMLARTSPVRVRTFELWCENPDAEAVAREAGCSRRTVLNHMYFVRDMVGYERLTRGEKVVADWWKTGRGPVRTRGAQNESSPD